MAEKKKSILEEFTGALTLPGTVDNIGSIVKNASNPAPDNTADTLKSLFGGDKQAQEFHGNVSMGIGDKVLETIDLMNGGNPGSPDNTPYQGLQQYANQQSLMDKSKGDELASAISKGKLHPSMGNDLGRGLIEGILGMPQSVPGSEDSIAYNIAKLPGDLVRAKIGLQSSAQSTVLKHTLTKKPQEVDTITWNKYQKEIPEYTSEQMINEFMKTYKVNKKDATEMISRFLSSKYPNPDLVTNTRRILNISSGMDDKFSGIMSALSDLESQKK
jgi:hypothetical protein